MNKCECAFFTTAYRPWQAFICSVSEWLRLLPFLGVLALLGYLAVRPFFPKKKQQKDSLINLKIQKENPKVVNEINIEDLCLTKAAYCRCWRSKTVRILFLCTLTYYAVIFASALIPQLEGSGRWCFHIVHIVLFFGSSYAWISLHFVIDTTSLKCDWGSKEGWRQLLSPYSEFVSSTVYFEMCLFFERGCKVEWERAEAIKSMNSASVGWACYLIFSL